MEEYDSLHQANIDGESKERPKPQDDPRVQSVPLPDAIRLLAEWIAIDHDKTRLQWEQYLVEAQELADYLHVIGYRQCPKEKWPVVVIPNDSLEQTYLDYAAGCYDQREADWQACHGEEKWA